MPATLEIVGQRLTVAIAPSVTPPLTNDIAPARTSFAHTRHAIDAVRATGVPCRSR